MVIECSCRCLSTTNSLIPYQHWSGVILPLSARQPEGRCYHTAYSLWDPDSNPQNPSLVVTSGLSEDAQTLGDLWVFEVNGLTWEEVHTPMESLLYILFMHPLNISCTSSFARYTHFSYCTVAILSYLHVCGIFVYNNCHK